MEIFKLRKKYQEKEPLPTQTDEEWEGGVDGLEKGINPQHILLAGAGLEVLRNINEKVERLETALARIEEKIEERLPEKTLSERKFESEIQSADEIVNKIISEVKELAKTNHVTEAIGVEVEKPSLVETKKIRRIRELLEQHEKLSSTQLAQLTNMSRTRCNEYFKQMEQLGLVESVLIGKEKFYKLID